MQHFLCFLPEPQGQGSLRLVFTKRPGQSTTWPEGSLMLGPGRPSNSRPHFMQRNFSSGAMASPFYDNEYNGRHERLGNGELYGAEGEAGVQASHPGQHIPHQ